MRPASILCLVGWLCGTAHATTLVMIANRVGAAIACDGYGSDAGSRPVVDGVRKVFSPAKGLVMGTAGIVRFQPGGIVLLDFTKVATDALGAQRWNTIAPALSRAGEEIGSQLAALPRYPMPAPPPNQAGNTFVIIGAVKSGDRGPVVFTMEFPAATVRERGAFCLRFASRPTVQIYPVQARGCEVLVDTRLDEVGKEASETATGARPAPEGFSGVRQFAGSARRDLEPVEVLGRAAAELVKLTAMRDPAIGGPVLVESCTWGTK